MRIFSWVHRRFTPRDGSGEQLHINEADTKALLLDGILSIGTLGQLIHATEDGDPEPVAEAEDDAPHSDLDNDEDPLLHSGSSAVEDEEDEAEKTKKERITLAELFSAESEEDGHRQHQAAPPGGLVFVKKKKSDSRPIQKLHGLMKRMLKRKIHPAADLNDLTVLTKPASPHPDAPPTITHQQLWSVDIKPSNPYSSCSS